MSTNRPGKTHPAGKLIHKLSPFSRLLFREWKRLKLPVSGANVLIAVSGGADSVALLLASDELVKSGKLKLQLHIAHLDHKLRASSQADARWVSSLAKELGYQVSAKSVDVQRLYKKSGDNLEQVARRERYSFFATVSRRKNVSVVLTAHTMDDQAETVMLKLIRGAGLDGLSGIEPVRKLEKSGALLARPLLSWARRQDTQTYCEARKIQYRVDEMNFDAKFARVRVRRQIVPLMEVLNPRLVEALARTAELLREEKNALDRGAALLVDLSLDPALKSGSGRSLRVDLLEGSPAALRRRALRLWLKQCRGDLRRLDRVHILALEKLLAGGRGGRTIELPGGAKVVRKGRALHFIELRPNHR